jgi:hypothetical protein
MDRCLMRMRCLAAKKISRRERKKERDEVMKCTRYAREIVELLTGFAMHLMHKSHVDNAPLTF